MTGTPDAATLGFYATPAPMTALPFDTCGARLADLPVDSAGAAEVVRGLLVHRDWLPALGVQFDDARLADQHRRSVRDVITRVLDLCDAPIVTERALTDRMVGVCRHFTTLHVALLRHAGVPARARVGFARYFEDGWVDHWVTQWWDGGTWVMTDPQVGPLLAGLLGLTFDPAAMPPGEFLTAGEAWSRCRAGDDDPARFGIFDLRGFGFIAGNVVQDLAACNKVELLPWDVWGRLGEGPGWAPAGDDPAARALDALAQLQRDDDLGALRARFADPDVAVPGTIVTIRDGNPELCELDAALLAV